MTVEPTDLRPATFDTDKLVQLARRSSLLTLDALLAAVPATDAGGGAYSAASRSARRLARRAEGSAAAFGADGL